MKQISLLLISFFSIILFSCSNNDEPQNATVLVNVIYEGAVASPSVVRLYKYEDAKDFDRTYSGACHYGNTGDLLDSNESIITPFVTGDNTLGVNTFENVPNGEYIIIAFYKPKDYSFSPFYYYGYKVIKVEGFLSSHFIEFKAGEYAQQAQGFVKF